MSDDPVDLDSRRGMAAQKATGLRRILADAESHAAILRERQLQIETELLDTDATSWPEAAAKARYILNLYYATLGVHDTHHRDLVASVLKDFARLDSES
ncbi:MAG: hypothetical protein EKK35_00855 [Bradyrhizobiaceae bacterium]|jgi:hypothetical protein|uniref:Uncharacterized protein n=1 Tax=Afipia broomeae ATCC 49717 TaxID=883078 RepID=K8PIC8_9BRAD|nr:hypothetical protein [Afipia broomeae]EKS41261.1 hypothetical protein HMPREF9695_00353 [Afipia broomeae ATCC 49717]RTL84330.1 MAG: hypothetical protein EKK35_00855 [Bradyrhizobiaceae bacterium]